MYCITHSWHLDHKNFVDNQIVMSTIFAEKINFLMVNQQTDIEEAKKRKQNFVKKKLFGYSRNFGGSDATNELVKCK